MGPSVCSHKEQNTNKLKYTKNDAMRRCWKQHLWNITLLMWHIFYNELLFLSRVCFKILARCTAQHSTQICTMIVLYITKYYPLCIPAGGVLLWVMVQSYLNHFSHLQWVVVLSNCSDYHITKHCNVMKPSPTHNASMITLILCGTWLYSITHVLL